jgi:hypothetical protein
VFAESIYFRLNRVGTNNTPVIDADQPGILVEMMDEMALRAGFTWRNSFGLLDLSTIEHDLAQNTTLDDLLQWTVESFDVSVAEWSKTVQRMERAVSFLEGWYDASIIMVGNPGDSQEKLDVWAFLLPFDAGVWVMIGLTIFVSGLVYWGLEWFDESSDRQSLEVKPQISIFLAALTFTGHFEFKPRTNGAMLFTISLAFWCLLIVAVYTANLASYLVARNQPSVNIESVEDVVIAGIPFCSYESSYSEQAVQTAFPAVKFIRKASENDIYLGVQNGECAFALTTISSWDEAQVDRTVHRDCQLEWIGRAFEFVEGSFAALSDSGTLCTSLVRDALNVHLLEMKRDGFVERAWSRHLEALTTVNCNAGGTNGDEDDLQLSLSDTGGLFIVHYGLTVVAIIIAIMQKWYCGRRDKAEDAQGSSYKDTRSDVASGGNGVEESIPNAQDLYEKHEKNLQNILAIAHSMQDELAAMRNLAADHETEKGF